MSLIQTADLGVRLKKFLSLTELPDQILASETVATIVVGDLTGGATDRACRGHVFEVGAAGTFSIAVLRNQPATGSPRSVAVRCTKVWISVENTQTVTIEFTGAPLGAFETDGEEQFQDLDQVGAPSTLVGSVIPAVAPASGTFWRARMLSNTTLPVPMNFLFGTVRAGRSQNSLIVRAGAQNTPIHASFEWEEFEPEPQ